MLWTGMCYSWAETQTLNGSDWSGNYSWFGTHVVLSKQVVLGAASLRKPESPMGLAFLGRQRVSAEAFPVAGTHTRALSHEGSLAFNNTWSYAFVVPSLGMFTGFFSFTQLPIFTTVGALNLSYMAETSQLTQALSVGDGQAHMHGIITYYSFC